MARAFGRILARIWDDEDFLALEPTQQRLYCFLLTQSNLNHAGLLPLTLRKWAKKAKGLTVAALRADLEVLDDTRFIVVDEDTEELLIRSFVRNDDVYKQPRVMGSMVSGAGEIESKRLRRALLAEMDRIPVETLSEEPIVYKSGNTAPSVRVQVQGHIDALRKAFADLDPEPSGPRRHPRAEHPAELPVEGVTEPLPEGVPEGVGQGDTEGLWGYARAWAPATRALPHPLLPTPTPSPAPAPEGFPAPVPAPRAENPQPWPQAEFVPLIDGLAAEGLVVDWNLSFVQFDKVRAAIERCGPQAMIAYALRRHRPENPAFSARAWVDGWASLPALSSDAQLAPVVSIDRKSSDLGGDEHMARFLARQAARREQTA